MAKGLKITSALITMKKNLDIETELQMKRKNSDWDKTEELSFWLNNIWLKLGSAFKTNLKNKDREICENIKIQIY